MNGNDLQVLMLAHSFDSNKDHKLLVVTRTYYLVDSETNSVCKN